MRLVEHTDFNMFDAFKIFDMMARGSLTLNEMNQGLMRNLDIIPSNDELELFFQRYDKDRDGRLRFAEFCQAFLPQDRTYCAMLN